MDGVLDIIKKSNIYLLVLIAFAVILFPKYKDNRPEMKLNLENNIKTATIDFFKNYCGQNISVKEVRVYNSMLAGIHWTAILSPSDYPTVGGTTGREYTTINIPRGCKEEGNFILDRNSKKFVESDGHLFKGIQDTQFPSDLEELGHYSLRLFPYLVGVIFGIYILMRIRKKENETKSIPPID